ncbi:MAG TPA: hypothetical protein VD927_06900 [Chryseosolibacter sp.]|nr:hypothetical protein [Chryseosolibacter sp.]
MKTVNKQVESYTRLVGLCTENGSMFNPARDAIKIDALYALLDKARKKHQMVNDTHHRLMSAINKRNDALVEMTARCQRAMNAARVLISQPGLLEDLRMYQAKIRGYNLGAIHGTHASAFAQEGMPGSFKKSRGPIPYLTISSKLDHFAHFIRCLDVPAYVPNEPDITVAGLKASLDELNTFYASMLNSWAAHRIAKNQLRTVVHSEEGLYGISKIVKLYIKSVFGARSTAFQMISQLKFTKK